MLWILVYEYYEHSLLLSEMLTIINVWFIIMFPKGGQVSPYVIV